MPNSIEFAKKYTGILDEVYQRAAVSNCLNSGANMVRAGRNAKEILIPKVEVTGLGDYARNVGYKTGSITWSYETHTFAYDRAIRLFADVMDIEEGGILDAFVAAGAELQRTQVAPEGDAYTFSEIASTEGVTVKSEDLSSATAEQLLASLRTVTSAMDERQVSTGSRYLFITPTLNGVIQDFSYANPNRSNRVLERFARVVEVPQVRFYSAIDLLSGDDDQFGYQKAAGTYVATTDTEVDSSKTYYTKSGDEYNAVASPTKSGLANYYELKGAGKDLNFMVVEKSAIIKYAKHVASRIFAPDELEALDSYMLKYRRYAIVSVLENKLDGVYVSASTE
ncbi:MAG: hypothetical protein J6D54_02380 [Olsenella sp.]|nr:hypothetical protein [Olsenella sp.]